MNITFLTSTRCGFDIHSHTHKILLSFIYGQVFNILSLTNCIMYYISFNALHKVTPHALEMMVQLYQNMQYYTAGDNTAVPN